MSGKTLSGTYSAYILSNPATQNPFTVAANGTISAAGVALYGQPDAWTIANYGTITGTGTGGIGISLASAGTIDNAAGGIIAGAAYGITLAGGGIVTNASGGAIQGAGAGVKISGGTGTVANAGTILASTTSSTGVLLVAGGTVANTGGTIDGTLYGIQSSNAATVTNTGRIGVSAVDGVALASGAVTNAAGAIIAGSGTGVRIVGAGTVIDAGTISGGTYSVYFHSGGADLLVVDPGAVLSGTVNGGNTAGSSIVSTLELASGASAGTLSGLGTKYVNFAQIVVDPGARWALTGANTLSTGVTFTDNGTLTNAGTLEMGGTIGTGGTLIDARLLTNSASIDGVVLMTGGTLVNALGATITGYNAAAYGPTGSAGGTVFNSGALTSGTISGRNAGVALLSGGYVSNAATGTITGGGVGVVIYNKSVTATNGGTLLNFGSIGGVGTHASGVNLNSGGLVSNGAGGTITGTNGGVEIDLQSTLQTATVINQGFIVGGATDASGIDLGYGGLANNSGTILSAGQGVFFGGSLGTAGTLVNSGYIGSTNTGTSATVIGFDHGGTLTNSGTIAAASNTATAVSFNIGYASRLIDNPGAVFTGTVFGSGGGSVTSVLELASAASFGTITTLGTQFTNFNSIVIDTGATWAFGGGDSITSGQTLTNAGAMLVNGKVTDSGVIVGNPGSITVGSAAGRNGTLTVLAGGTVDLLSASGTNTSLFIGNATASGTLAAATGTVIVTGTGALLESQDQISVGKSAGATGVLKVAQGGSVLAATSNETVSAALTVGQFGNGTVVVTDANSELTSDGVFWVGRAGTGTLLIENDGSVILNHDGAGNQAQLQIGVGNGTNLAQSGGLGIATVTSGGVLNSTSLIMIGGNNTSGTLVVSSGTLSGGTTVAGGTVAAAVVNIGVATTIGGTVYGGAGVVTIGTGALVETVGTVSNSRDLFIGAGPSSSGTVTLNGGTLNTVGGLVVGNNSAGTLTVNAGGTVDAQGGLSAAANAGSSGSITVNGGTLVVGMPVANNVAFILGQNGAAVLTLEGGGTIVATQTQGPALDIGLNSTGTGTAVVTGANSVLQANGQLIVGDRGTGSLDVNSGAFLNASTYAMNVGNQSGATGILSVESGATLAGGALNVSNGFGTPATTGTVTVSSGATVSVTSINANPGGAIVVGGTLLSGGTVYPALLTSNGVTGGIAIATNGTGGAASLTVNAGGIVSETGTINVFGTGTVFGTLDSVNIGNSFGTTAISGTVTVNGGTLLAADGVAANEGTLTAENGGLVSTTSLTISSFNTGAAASMSVTNGATVSVSNLMDAGGGTIVVGGTLLANGTVYPAVLTSSGASGGISIGSGNGGSASLTIDAGGIVSETGTINTFGTGTVLGISDTFNIGSGGTTPTSGTVAVAGGTLSVADGLNVGNSSIGVGSGGSGTLSLSNGLVTVGGTNALTVASNLGGQALVAVSGGTLMSNGIALGGFNNGAGTLTVTGGLVENTGTNNVDAGQSTGGNGLLVINGGTLADTTGFFGVGNFGASGTLLLQSGSLITGGNGNLADINSTSGGAAKALVSGGAWTSNGEIIVGDGGSGSLDVSAGVVNAGTNAVVLGNSGGGSGTVTVEGTGTLLGGPLQIAKPLSGSASGTLAVGAGGTAGFTSIAVGGGGTIVVGGTSTAQLSDSGSFAIGQTGTGAAMTVSSHGTVTGASADVVQIGQGTGTSGTVTVDGGTITGIGGIVVGNNGAGTLIVENSGLLSANGGNSIGSNIGGGTSGSGTVIINNGTLLDTGTGLLIGGSNTGATLLVEGGGLLSTSASGAGQAGDIDAGGTGSAIVTVSAATWDASGNVVVGDSGAGSLDINSNGLVSVSSGSLTVGNQTTGSGVVSIESGTLASTGNVQIGSNGSGLVTVDAGGTLLAQGGLGLDLQVLNTSSGTLIVNGGSVSDTGALTIGAGGTAVVVVEAGGVLTQNGTGAAFAPASIGSSTGGTASVTVNGGLFTTNGTAGLFVGNGGNGSLLVENGGSVVTTFTGSGPAADIDAGLGSRATVTVTGTGSVWDIVAGAGDQLAVGDQGSGSLVVANGATVNVGANNIVLGNQASGSGFVDVAGGGAMLQGGSLLIGSGTASSMLELGIGGTIAVSGVEVRAGGTLQLAGGVLDPSIPVQIDAGATVAGYGTVDGTVTNFGTLIASGGLLSINGALIDDGGVTVAAGSSLAASGGLYDNGSFTNGGSISQAITLGSGASFTNLATGAINPGTSAAAVSGSSGPGTVVNAGLISGAAGGVVLAAGGTVTNSGTISSPDYGVRILGGGTLVNTGTGLVQGGVMGVHIAGTSASVGNSGRIIGGGNGVDLATTTWSLNNDGTIASTTLDNGVHISSGAGTLTNGGTIGGYYAGVWLTGVGTVAVDNTGTMMGSHDGLYFNGQAAALTNSGLVASTTLDNGVSIKAGSANVTNTGIVSGAYDGFYFGTAAGVGTITNAGTISGAHDAVQFAAGSANRLVVDPRAVFSGTVDGGNTIGATVASTVELASGASAGTLSGLGSQYINFAQTQIDSGASWTLTGANYLASGATITNLGTLILSNGTLSGASTIIDDGSIVLDPSTFVGSGIIGTGAVTIEAGSTLDVAGTIASGITVDFAAASGGLALGNAAQMSGTIAGFVQGDTIDLIGVNNTTIASTDLLSGDVLQINLTGGGTYDLQMAGDFSGEFFHHNAAGSDTLITVDNVPCYLHGTRIKTPRGEVLVEKLQIGDRIVTLDGTAKPIKWIGRRSYAGAIPHGLRDVIPIRIRKGALGKNLPKRDLVVSPLHAMFIDGVLVPAEHLVNGITILRSPEIDPIRYFHIELAQHDVIFADGAPAETFVDCDSRSMFHNAREFADLYPGDTTPRWRFCFPRVEGGDRLAEIKRAIDRRAGIELPDPGAPPGRLEGRLDGVEGGRISGWAYHPDRPADPVWLEVLDGDGVLARVHARRYRADLEEAGVGDGRHGFELHLTGQMRTRREIRVRRVEDGVELAGSPLVIESRAGADLLEDARRLLAAAILDPSDGAALDALTAELLHGVDALRQARARVPSDGTHGAPSPDLSRTRERNPHRALIIDAQLPRPEHDAGSQAILSHAAALTTLGYQVEFVATHELARAEQTAIALEAAGYVVHRAPRVASVEEVLRRHRNGFDVVYLHRLANAEAYAPLARLWQARARLLYCVADLHHMRLARQAAVQASAELAADARSVRAREINAMRLCDAVITHSPAEAAYLAKAAPGAHVHVIPWTPAAKPRSMPLAARQGVAAIGSWMHEPNVDAVRWLSTDIMPRVWAAAPKLELLVVGSDWPARVPWIADPRIRLVGAVASIESLLAMVRVTVAPLRFGAGLKGKVLDSFACEVPCVMSSVAAEGFPLNGTLPGLVSDDADALAALIVRLHQEAPFHRAAVRDGLAMAATFSAGAVQAAMAVALGLKPAGAPAIAAAAPATP